MPCLDVHDCKTGPLGGEVSDLIQIRPVILVEPFVPDFSVESFYMPFCCGLPGWIYWNAIPTCSADRWIVPMMFSGPLSQRIASGLERKAFSRPRLPSSTHFYTSEGERSKDRALWNGSLALNDIHHPCRLAFSCPAFEIFAHNLTHQVLLKRLSPEEKLSGSLQPRSRHNWIKVLSSQRRKVWIKAFEHLENHAQKLLFRPSSISSWSIQFCWIYQSDNSTYPGLDEFGDSFRPYLRCLHLVLIATQYLRVLCCTSLLNSTTNSPVPNTPNQLFLD